jgi:hypothetical protein
LLEPGASAPGGDCANVLWFDLGRFLETPGDGKSFFHTASGGPVGMLYRQEVFTTLPTLTTTFQTHSPSPIL